MAITLVPWVNRKSMIHHHSYENDNENEVSFFGEQLCPAVLTKALEHSEDSQLHLPMDQ